MGIMKRRFAVILLLFAMFLPCHALADEHDNWVAYSGNPELTAEVDSSSLLLNGTTTITLEATGLIDSALPISNDSVAAYIESSSAFSSIYSVATRQTLTEAGPLKGQFILLALDMQRISDVMPLLLSGTMDSTSISIQSDTYQALGLSQPAYSVDLLFGVPDGLEYLVIPVAAGSETTVSVNATNELFRSGPVEVLSIKIDASALAFAPLETKAVNMDSLQMKNGDAVSIAPALQYSARTAAGVQAMDVPGTIDWAWSDTANSGVDATMNNRGRLTSLESMLQAATYALHSKTDITYTATPKDARFSPVSGVLTVETVEMEQQQASTPMAAGGGSPSVDLHQNTYSGFGDFMIRTGAIPSQLSGLMINGVRLVEGVDYTIEETAGNIATIRVYESYMQSITEGRASIIVSFVNGSVQSSVMVEGFYVPDELPEPPKTGDAASPALGMLLLAAAFAAWLFVRRARA